MRKWPKYSFNLPSALATLWGLLFCLFVIFTIQCKESGSSSSSTNNETEDPADNSDDSDVSIGLPVNTPASDDLELLTMETPMNTRFYFSSQAQLSFALFFNEVVEVEGTPRIAIEFTDISKKIYAEYQSGSGSTRLLFAYTIAFGDFGHLTYNDQIDLNGGRIASEGNINRIAPTQLPSTDLSDFVLWPCEDSGYTFIEGVASIHDDPFCVSAVEMRDNNGVPTPSLRPQLPWANISQTDALAKCQSLGSQYNLMNEAQWNALVHHIESDKYNWDSHTVGSSGGLSRGHSDRVPNNAIPIQGHLVPCEGTGESCDLYTSWNSQKRLFLFLGVGNRTWHVWDLAGNLAEWMRERTDSDQAIIRGGSWANGRLSWANSNMPVDTGYHYVGFRCTYTP